MDALPVRTTAKAEVESTSTTSPSKTVMDHYIGIDVGTGSARACVINANGDIVGLASEDIGLWQPEQGYYVRYTLSLINGQWLLKDDLTRDYTLRKTLLLHRSLTHYVGAIYN
jgi:hypothetical protein